MKRGDDRALGGRRGEVSVLQDSAGSSRSLYGGGGRDGAGWGQCGDLTASPHHSWVLPTTQNLGRKMSLQGQDKQSHSQATSLLGKGDTQEHPVSVTACSAAPRVCGSHPSDGVWERLPGTVWGGGLGLAAMTYRTLEDQAALTLKLACSVITSAGIWLSLGLSLPRLLSPDLCHVEERACLWAAGTYTCAWGGMAGLPSSLRGLVSEGLSSGGEAGKEGWLNVNVQDRWRRGLWERGKFIVCKLLKKYRVKVTLSFIFSMVPTTRLHEGRLRNEQVPTSWVMTRKKARQIKEAGVTVEEPGRDQCHKASAAGISSFQIPPSIPQRSPTLGGRGAAWEQLSMKMVL